jgi:hypothetical protein
VYHLEGEGIIWIRRLSSGVVCIIWWGRVSSEAGEYRLERVYHLEWECIIWRGVYHLEGEGIIWSKRVSS